MALKFALRFRLSLPDMNNRRGKIQSGRFFLGTVFCSAWRVHLRAKQLADEPVANGPFSARPACWEHCCDHTISVRKLAAVKLVETSGLFHRRTNPAPELLAVQSAPPPLNGSWVQEYSASTVTAAREISDKMVAEAAAFTEFLKKTKTGKNPACALRWKIAPASKATASSHRPPARPYVALSKLPSAFRPAGLIEQNGQLSKFLPRCRAAHRIGPIRTQGSMNRSIQIAISRLNRRATPFRVRSPRVRCHRYTYQGGPSARRW